MGRFVFHDDCTGTFACARAISGACARTDSGAFARSVPGTFACPGSGTYPGTGAFAFHRSARRRRQRSGR